MFKAIKQKMKDQRGLTLIELLAVVVILGIIAAIAVPSIGGLIDNTKKDAHVANATQMINSAKLYVTGAANDSTFNTAAEVAAGTNITLTELMTKGYLDTMTDPDGGAYDGAASLVNIKKAGNKYSYTVTLKGSKRNITGIADGALKRDNVTNNTP